MLYETLSQTERDRDRDKRGEAVCVPGCPEGRSQAALKLFWIDPQPMKQVL